MASLDQLEMTTVHINAWVNNEEEVGVTSWQDSTGFDPLFQNGKRCFVSSSPEN
jgi:hypothetical protein